jgi:hypothetical protein
MIDIARALQKLYPDLVGWSVVNNEIVDFPKDVKRPTQAELEQAWAEVQAEDKRRAVEQARKARYEQETDPMLYDALAKPDLPELAEWKRKRDKIKKELPYEE